MTHRELVIRLAEAYIKSGQTIEADKIIKIADYFMAHTNDYSGYNTSDSWIRAVNTGNVVTLLKSTTSNEATCAKSIADNTVLSACTSSSDDIKALTADSISL